MRPPRFSEVKHLPINQALRDYMVRNATPVDPVITELADRTAANLGYAAGMQIPSEQAALLTMLTRLTGARLALDIGTFTGLSALAMARGLSPGGRVITCDITEKWGLARDFWQKAQVAELIDFRVGPAVDTLRGLSPGTVIDIVFLDADKESYETYFGLVKPLLRSGGLLIVDNVLFNGYVMDPGLADEGVSRDSARALHAFNPLLAADDDLESVMLPISDGLTIARKR
jgi:predicted O-methyltransferase YrrM